ncbi:hypothetical protein HPB51_020259 [Rhipicephalus microplus]|uniref:Uncharacterized protein n=1 Tax=Rhipicephalus microplus TaxID=6941 RepID=A0A9J6EUL1_RHIMP|nr:hypothetical protein HPB51_020259 [Rhipicephalus microplus]
MYGEKSNKNQGAMPRQKPLQRPSWTPALELGTDTTSAVEPQKGWEREQDRSGAKKNGPAHREDPREGALQEIAHSVKDVQGADGVVLTRVRRRRKNRKHQLLCRVGFLNMNGARYSLKWEELYRTMTAEHMMIYAVAETHLRKLEEPPIHPEWRWEGKNRAGHGRKRGGVGFQWHREQQWQQGDRHSADHM